MLYRWLDHMASVVGPYEVLYDGWLNHIVRFFLFFFPYPIHYLRSPFSLPPIDSRNSDPGSHGRFFSLLTAVRALYFYREKIWALSSLVDSRRIVPTHARGALSSWPFFPFFLQIKSRFHHGRIRTLLIVSIVAFEGWISLLYRRLDRIFSIGG